MCAAVTGCSDGSGEGPQSSNPETSNAESTNDTDSSVETSQFEPGKCDVKYTEDECWELALKINNKAEGDVVKIKSDVFTLYEPEAGHEDGWYFNHIVEIFQYNDLFVAMWTNGKRHENDICQRVLWSHSEDGMSWSEPEILFDSATYSDPEISFVGLGFAEYNGTLFAYAQTIKITRRPTIDDPALVEFEAYHVRTSTDGLNWTEREVLNTANSYMSAQLRSGRYLTYFRGRMASYTDRNNEATGYGGGWKNTYFRVDDAYSRGSGALSETAFFQNDDGVVFMFFRSNTKRLWCCMSFDEGESWSKIYSTNFSDGISRVAFGRLPDGRYYCVSNPVYDDEFSRNPLVLSISEDGINFSKQYIIRDETDYVMKMDGFQKPGDFAYPSVTFDEDYMYIAYTKKKETVEITRIALGDIE